MSRMMPLGRGWDLVDKQGSRMQPRVVVRKQNENERL
jgi:hypothetical protein